MSKKNKKIILGVLVGVLIGTILGVTYAIFSYSRIGGNEQLITGDIYMHYKESNTLTLENALPSSTYDSTKYFEFTIDGKNTNTLYDIYYDINLLRGDVPTGKVEANRIQDKFLKFRLVEVINNEETEIFTNKSYSDLSSAKRVHVATIPKNTTSEITHRYRLYMWIGNEVVIGNTGNSEIDYDMTIWNNLFASIKVRATGDFEEKSMATDASCFTTALNISNATLNTNMTNEELQACVDYLTNKMKFPGDATAYCQGENTEFGTFQGWLDGNSNGVDSSEEITYFEEHNIISGEEVLSITGYDTSCGSDVIIPSSLPLKTYTLNSSMTNEELQTCVDYISNKMQIPEDATAYCQGTGTNYGYTFQDAIENGYFEGVDLAYFKEHNIISGVESTNNYPVTTIRRHAFHGHQLTSVTIPNSVSEIENQAFASNQLTSVVIPNSVTVLSCGAFDNNVNIIKENENLVCVSDSGGGGETPIGR